MTYVYFLFAGFLIGLSFLGSYYLFSIPIGIILFILGIKETNVINSLTGRNPIIKKDSKTTLEPIHIIENKTSFEVEITDFNTPKLHDFRNKVYEDVESNVNNILEHALFALKKTLVNTYSICVFFPYGKKAIQLRMYKSNSSVIIENAIIQHNNNLVGSLINHDVNSILESNLMPEQNLDYYADFEAISSIAAVPIIVNQKRHGAILVDSLELKAFNERTIEILNHFAELIGMMCYTASINFYESVEKAQFRSLVRNQETFLESGTVDEIFDKAKAAIQDSLPYERLMILSLDRKNKDQGRIIYTEGMDADFFQNLDFSLNDKGILLTCFKKTIINKTFSNNEYLMRVNENEKPSNEFLSLLAVPIITNIENNEVGAVIAIESKFPHRYKKDIEQELLEGIANYTGIALQRTYAYEKKEESESKDTLTGLMNHRSFQEWLKRERFRAQRMDYSLGAIVIDIDYFKKINEAYNYSNGDKILVQVAEVINKELRSEIDVLSRYGGEEFIAMLVDTNKEAIIKTAERIRRAVEVKEYNISRIDPIKLSVSVGCTILRPGDSDINSALNKAEKAMLYAKSNGRNKVVSAM